MKLSSLSSWLMARRRWLLLPAAALLALVPVLPGPLRMLLMAFTLFCASLLLVYCGNLLPFRGPNFTRWPTPQDAQAETILIDASLIDEGTHVRCVSQPFNIAAEMSLSLGSGALVMGTAMTLLANELPPADRSAVLSAIRRLNIRSDMMRSRSPILERREEGGATAIVVQDGLQERTYWLGGAAELLAICGTVWDKNVRFITADDRSRLTDAAAYMAAGGCRVLAYATSLNTEKPVFLGLVGLGDGLREEAVSDITTLRAHGLTVLLNEDGATPVDVAFLRRTLELGEMNARADLHLTAAAPSSDPRCLTIDPAYGGSLAAPVLLLRSHFAWMEHMLRRFGGTLGLLLALCAVCGSMPTMALIALTLLAAVVSFGPPERGMHLHPASAAMMLAGGLAVRLFTAAVAPAAAPLAGSILCMLLTALAVLRLRDAGSRNAAPDAPADMPSAPARPADARPVIIAGAVSGAVLLLTCLPVISSLAAPTLFACLIGGAACLAVSLIQR